MQLDQSAVQNALDHNHTISRAEALKILEWACLCPDDTRSAGLLRIFRDYGGLQVLAQNIHSTPATKEFSSN